MQPVRPGVETGKAILSVDLTLSGDYIHTMSQLAALNYYPEIRHVQYTGGVHVLAVLKDQAVESDEELTEEWMFLQEIFNSTAVRLWMGKTAP